MNCPVSVKDFTFDRTLATLGRATARFIRGGGAMVSTTFSRPSALVDTTFAPTACSAAIEAFRGKREERCSRQTPLHSTISSIWMVGMVLVKFGTSAISVAPCRAPSLSKAS